MATVEVHGTAFAFGIKSADAPVISGFFPRSVTLDFEPAVNETAMDGEGNVESRAISKADARKITGSITGYVAGGSGPGTSNDIPTYFDWNVAGFNPDNRHFIIGKIHAPIEKGKYVEVTIDVFSDPLIVGGTVPTDA